MFKIVNYKHLEVNHTYRIFNSLGESFLYLYRGYHYDEEFNGDVLIFFKPGTRDFVGEWSVDEFEYAIDNDQEKYQELVETISSRMNDHCESFIVALINYERLTGNKTILVLHEAGVTMKEFREAVISRIRLHCPHVVDM